MEIGCDSLLFPGSMISATNMDKKKKGNENNQGIGYKYKDMTGHFTHFADKAYSFFAEITLPTQ